VRSADVEERQPGEARLEAGVHDGQPEHVAGAVAVEGAHQLRAVGHAVPAERHVGGHAVGTVADRVPRQDVSSGDRSFGQLAVDDLVLDVHVLGSVDERDETDVVGSECPDRHGHGRASTGSRRIRTSSPSACSRRPRRSSAV
jgi:hypothetical protein